jgi:hypothetical protein
MDSKNIVSGLLVGAFLILASLIPGGPIETRNFSHIETTVLIGFNTFLTLLGMASLVLSYYVHQGRSWAFIWAALSGFAYFLVYGLDLAEVFPSTPDNMSPILMGFELIGGILAIPLMTMSLQLHLKKQLDQQGDDAIMDYSAVLVVFVSLLLLIAISIIIFATKSAMGQ